MATSTLLKSAGASHPGQEREVNEDRFYIDRELAVFVVIDGIGGQAAGEIAAETALKLIRARLERQTGTAPERLREAITLANNEIYRLAQSNDQWRGMACVLTAAIIENNNLTVGHVGDTRLYKIQTNQITKITPDHSPIGVREDAGELSETEAMRHPRRNEVYRDVGSVEHSPDDKDFIEIIEVKFEPDSAFLLCSDGLTDLVSANQILQIVQRRDTDPALIVDELIQAANTAGGKDNVTVVFVEGEYFGSASTGRERNLAEVKENRKYAGKLLSVFEKGNFAFYNSESHGIRRFKGYLSSRWAFLVYGAIVATLLSALIQAFAPLRFAPKQISTVSSDQRASLVVNQSGESGFASINAALAKAHPGDTIEVAPGEYHEQIKLREDISLISLKPGEAIIRLTDEASLDGAAVEANNIRTARFFGFRIIGNDKAPLSVGLRLINSSVVVEETEVTGAQNVGVEITGDGVPTLRASYIHDNAGAGILIRGGDARPRLLHNVIVENGKRTAPMKAGIELEEEARPILIRNTIADNGIEGIAGLSSGIRDEVIEKNFFGSVRKQKSSQSSNRRSQRR